MSLPFLLFADGDAGERLWVNLHYVAFNNGCTSYEYVHKDPDEYA